MTKRKTEGSTRSVDAVVQEGATLSYSQKIAEDMFAVADVSKVYGRPIKHEGTMIVPAAEVLWAGGYGAGSGFGEGGPLKEEDDFDRRDFEGTGGGGHTFARPVAVIIASEDGVRVEPVIDPTKIFMAALTAGGFMAAMAFRMMSPRKALRGLKSE
jgi:uncharacterized spore protein YtfJ